ncbi:MAG: outer membrane protein assembly factor BamD [Nitrospinae bacterium CG11_big_fil_rev_8_21_14_0_20_45_15]|nr:MAG: outer membrane protein assembly factor BamD [Nitrospinae bacterium CG11_big_fil_rev_8_21_14_0_20_45_15]
MKIVRLLSSFVLPIAFIFTLLSSWGCTSTKSRFNLPPDKLLQKGKELAKSHQSTEAIEAFQQLLEEYPNSQERISALMLLGDVHYNDEEFEEAKFQYMRFTQQHPAHKYADRAFFYASMCDFRQMDVASRDQTHTQKAIRGFELLISTFPDSKYVAESKKKLEKSKETLATNMFEIGKFYFRTQSFQASILRLEGVLKEYPNQKFVEEALYMLGESYLKEQNFEAAKKTFDELFKQFPKGVFTKQARLDYPKTSRNKKASK